MTMTTAERTLKAHGQVGYELPDGRLRVLCQWTRDHGTVKGSTWETIPSRDLMAWLGY